MCDSERQYVYIDLGCILQLAESKEAWFMWTRLYAFSESIVEEYELSWMELESWSLNALISKKVNAVDEETRCSWSSESVKHCLARILACRVKIVKGRLNTCNAGAMWLFLPSMVNIL